MNSFNVDQIVEYIKTIANACRCVSCDELKGVRVRYPCGHSVCDNCVLTAADCLLCLSPPDVSTHVSDWPLTLRVENATNLLHSFQELFNLDVYRRQRVSEQLQLEKQLFPQCIQAPSKYSNSRRSSNILIKNKENIKHIPFPGENTSKSYIFKMENKMSYVQQWLNKSKTSLRESNLPRKPFTDINVNCQNVTRPKKQNKITKRKKAPSRNKNCLKSFKSESKDKSKLSLKIMGKDDGMKIGKEDLNCKKIKCDKNESGIFIDDEIEIIDDAESLDKDKEAWLAVIEADKNNPCDTTVSKFSKSENEKLVDSNHKDEPFQCPNVESIGKVPFYKKSSLLQCVNNQFMGSMSKNEIIENSDKTNNSGTIKVDCSGFVITINFCEEQDATTERTKYSVGVQTEKGNLELNSDDLPKIVELKVLANENCNLNGNNLTSDKTHNVYKQSVDLLEEITPFEANHRHTHHSLKQPKCLIIDDSESDSDILPTEKDSILEVTAEVHQSETENDCSVLSQLEHGEYENRKRPAVREHTSASTDSSDKENYDPNRVKRHKLDKKVCCKKD